MRNNGFSDEYRQQAKKRYQHKQLLWRCFMTLLILLITTVVVMNSTVLVRGFYKYGVVMTAGEVLRLEALDNLAQQGIKVD